MNILFDVLLKKLVEIPLVKNKKIFPNKNNRNWSNLLKKLNSFNYNFEILHSKIDNFILIVIEKTCINSPRIKEQNFVFK